MSSAETSPNKSLSTWWKQLKRHSNTSNDSLEVPVLSINDVLSPNSQNNSSISLHRPSLNFKSRSFTSVRRPSNENENLIRQQRDEFIAAQKKTGFGANEVFGVELDESIKIAESLISVPSDDPDEFIRYGKIPLVIGKCGSFLKEKGLKVEGIFRIAGASRRVKELQYIFSTPPEYGRKLTWEGYTVHDAASLFRRFLNNLPEPLVPLALYEEFREPVKSRPRILNHIKTRNETIEKRIRKIQQEKQKSETGEMSNNNEDDDLTKSKLEDQKQKDARKQKRIAKDLRNALKEYRILFEKLPPSQRHLLFYLLDMLTMFSDSAKENLMSSRNLAAIFQPSILSHPQHDLTPEEYALSQAVVEVLIEYSNRLLPDVKKHSKKTEQSTNPASESPPSLSRGGSNKNSSVNLLAVRNSSKGSRPHSRSLSSVTAVPDAITKSSDSIGDDGKQNTENHDSDDNDDEDDDDDDNDKGETEQLQNASSDDDETKYHDPLNNEIPHQKIQLHLNTKEATQMERRVSESEHTPQEPTQRKSPVNSSRPRPVSMFPGALSHALHSTSSQNTSNDEERQSRWFSKNSPTSDDFLSPGKKESWFKRLRSSSRGRGQD